MENIEDLGELFEQVQMQSIFPDGKTFVDCKPKIALSDIRNRYEAHKGEPGFNLSAFVHGLFNLPSLPAAAYESVAGRPIIDHINLLWKELTRKTEESGSSLISLPHPFVVPGGRFREMFYWDSYFTMLGLEISGQLGLVENMVDNFSYLIDTFGYIPNGNRSYFLGRSQPPFYACMVNLLNKAKANHDELKDGDVLIKYLPQLEKEYNFWMRGIDDLDAVKNSINRVALMPDGSVLNHYWDESDTARAESFKEDVELSKDASDRKRLFRNIRAACESGWDFSSRWFGEDGSFLSIRTTDIIPADLNCLLYNLEQTIAEAHQNAKNVKAFERYSALADKRKNAINTYCWNKAGGFYFDYDYLNKQPTTSLTLAATYPLFFKIADEEKAQQVVEKLKQHFLFPGGLQTTTRVTTQQWDSPNGWAPLQWITVQGLLNYGYSELAIEIATRWINLNETVYNNSGKMMEKYNVVSIDLPAGGGEYLSQDGFGWTNGVYLALNKLIRK